MGLLDRLLRRTTDRSSTSPVVAPATGSARRGTAASLGYAVLDLETTGLSPAHDRVVEVAVVHVSREGHVGEGWATLVHPGRTSVGATRIHGITPADVRGAPHFADITHELVRRLAGRVVVAHNARFDLPFLRAELARAGVATPPLPHLCTLEESHRQLPRLPRRRLADCCDALGVDLTAAHSALGDATATASLLARYLRSTTALSAECAELLHQAATTAWPAVTAPARPAVPRPRRSTESPVSPAAAGRLAALLDELPLDSPDLPLPEAAGYLEVLAAAMADGVLTDDEVDALRAAATAAGLSRAQVHAAHRGTLLALARAVVEDGVITAAERAEVLATAEVLALGTGEVAAVLDEASAERVAALSSRLTPLPTDWHLGEPLRLGDAVVFTGGDEALRARLERRCRDTGLRVVSAVSRRTAVLVTDDVTSGTGKARRALELGTRVVDAATLARLLDHVQPALPVPPAPTSARDVEPQRLARVVAPATPAVVDLRPVDVRAWARTRGLTVSDRGRLPQSVLDAYAAEHGARART